MVRQNKQIACIILQRNMPEATKRILDHIKPINNEIADFFVVESGSDADKVIQYSDITVFHADWDDAKQNGLRTGRGFNFSLLELKKIGKEYDYYMMLTGDCFFQTEPEPNFKRLIDLFEKVPKLGILSPVSLKWGNDCPKDKKLFPMFLIPLVCYMFRKECLDKLISGTDYYDYLFSAQKNFRSYDLDTKICIEAYIKDYCFCITNEILIYEDEGLIYNNINQTKTEAKELHRSLMFKEGMEFLKETYGFENKSQMRNLGYSEMINFFRRNHDMVEILECLE